ncbi:MAG: NAD(P)-dependent oxidoreductase, partial [Chloroflexi bacterium]|nr:NAD(P)-dependent oxidoreductase [Chloroflexota bacterium]
MEISAVANADVEEGVNALLAAGIPREQIVTSDQTGDIEDAIKRGKRVVTADPRLLAQIDSLDIVTDSTWSPAIGADVAESCIQYGKDVVLVNIEADVTVGHILKKKAAGAGVLYSVSSGDEPGCLMELFDYVKSLGYEVITIGKGKNNPLNTSATPDLVADSAAKADKDPIQVASYVDGTKTMFEMTCAANAMGCRPMQRGMIGPEASFENVSQIFALEEDGGISQFPGNIDFVQGPSMSGGVFVTVRVEDERIQADLNYLKVGSGKYFTFFRHYHLWFLEASISIAKAYLHKEVWLTPLNEPIADVMTVAKKDLKPGDILERFGGYTNYGVMELAGEARKLNALPVGLSPDAKVIKQVKAGEIVTWADVALDEESTVVKLRRAQDQLFQ